MRQSPLAQVDERTSAKIGNEGQRMLVRECGQANLIHGFGKATNLVITRVDFHDEAGLRPDGFLIIFQVGAIGGANLHQFATGALHDLGHAEFAADLDQFAARQNHLATQAQGIQGEQHCRRVVVDHRGFFCAGETT